MVEWYLFEKMWVMGNESGVPNDFIYLFIYYLLFIIYYLLFLFLFLGRRGGEYI